METKLTKNDILFNKTPITKLRGIYFLIRCDEIVYVGQAADIISRVYHHTKKKVFDSFTYLECKDGDMNLIEAEYILEFNPVYNRKLPKNDKYKSFDVLLILTGAGQWGRAKLKDFIKNNKIKPIYNRHCNYYHVKDFRDFPRGLNEH